MKTLEVEIVITVIFTAFFTVSANRENARYRYLGCFRYIRYAY